MNFLHQLTGGRSGNSNRSAANSSRSAHSHGAAYSHRSTRESVGRRVHADTSHHNGVSSSKTGIGAVLIMAEDGVDPAAHTTTNSDGKLIPHDHYFVAVLAPDSDSAMAYLVSQPAGTYLFVRESGDELAMYIKFVQAVRSFTVAKGKEIKKTGESLVDWGRPYHTLTHDPRHVEALISQTTVMAPVHRITLQLDAYQYLEKCWLRFLPQMQAIVFELCSQSFYMDEDIAMEDWSTFILASRVPSIAFLSVDSCGFHLINTSAIADAAFNDGSLAALSGSASAVVAALSVPVRLVEFDVSKCLISITDGVFRPSSFVTPVNFGNAKLYDAELGFTTIRDNFLTPERVALKEASSATTQAPANGASVATPGQWHDLGMSAAISGDMEMQLLLGMLKCTASMIPHEPLPEGFIDAFTRLHALWVGQTPAQCRGRWRTPDKVKCSARILPYYVELFLATATTDSHVTQELRTTGKPDLLPCFAAALSHDILHMARRVDDETVARLALHLLQALQLRAEVPSQLVSLMSDLVVESQHFRVLFMRNQGASLLWKAIQVAVPLNVMASPQLLIQTLSLQRNTPLLGATTKRRSSLFGGRRKSNPRASGGSSRRSMAFNASLVMPVTMECSVQVYFRVNPVLVQLELAPQLRETHFMAEDLVFRAKGSDFQSSAQSALTEMIHFIERVAFFLMADPSSPTWEKDVTQLLRMEDLYEHLYREAVACVIESAAQTHRRMSISIQSVAGEHAVEPILECIAALYRLETKRRRHTTTGIGEKRYWYLFHLLRNPVRAYHEAMSEIMNALDSGEISSASAQPDASQTNANYAAYDLEDRGPTATTGFVVLTQVLPKLPRQFVTEFVLVSLDDLLQATRILDEFIQRGLVGAIPYVRLLVSIFTIMLKRTCDFDLQLLLVRVLASSGSSMPALLQLLAKESVNLKPEAGGCAIELELMAFVEAFVALATSLQQKEQWHEIHETLYTTLENKDDVEGNEQRKTMLMATVLSPENGVADSDEILWDTIQSILLPAPPRRGGEEGSEISSRLLIVDCFLSKDIFTVWDSETGLVPFVASVKLRAFKAYLRVRARLFLSPMLESAKATLAHLTTQIEFHWDHIYELREQYKTTLCQSANAASGTPTTTAPTLSGEAESTVKIDGSECQALVLLHLQCVIALASRRSELPALDEAFRDFRTARELLRILRLESSKAIAVSSSAAASASSSAGSALASLDAEPKADGLRSPMGLSLNLDKLSRRTTSWSESSFATLAVSTWKTDELLLSSPELHAATLVAIMACIVSEPYALSESLVPRFFIPQPVEGSSLNLLPDEDLLLTLQRHLSFVNSPELRGAIHAALQNSEFEQLVGSPARAHAVRTLARILLPDSYDSHLFQTATGSSSNCISVREHRHQTTTLTTHGGDESDAEDHHLQTDKAAPADPLVSTLQPRTYIAKGAFASVYRATPSVYDAIHTQVAIKVWAHQRSSGDLCVAAELFNEITVLEHLQGNMAATQILDYGNDTRDNQGFEVVMEHCPATLAQWRKTLDAEASEAHEPPQMPQDGEPKEAPFRTLLSLVLSVFVDVASALSRIHSSQVCHFDVKADNVLVRVDAATLTVETLRKLRQPSSPADASYTGSSRVCLADFGESIVLSPLSGPEGVVLSRTRGTEAIKSPEMLSVRGGGSTRTESSKAADSLVGPASDVWSLGCLLYELVTEELMFGNDDWAQLYAHIVAAPSSTPIVRDDHRHKLLQALHPKTDAEKGLTGVFINFLGSILQRDVAARPTIDKVINEAEIQLRMIQSLPTQPEDDAYARAMLQRHGEPSSLPTLLLPVARSLASAPRPKIVQTAESAALGRLFFNFYLAKDVWALQQATPDTASATAMAMATPQGEARLRRELSALQLRYESSFTHFIYFCYDDVKRRLLATNNADSTTLAADASSASEFVEIVEGVGRTVFYFSRARVLACLKEASDTAANGDPGGRASAVSSFSKSVTSPRGTTTAAAAATTATTVLDGPSGPSLIRLLLQYSRGILPVLQRHLRHQSDRVLIVPADYNVVVSDQETSQRPLTELTATTLLFFLVTSCGLSPLQAQARFARECGSIVDLPSPRLLHQLHRLYDQLQSVATSVSESESTAQSRTVVRCRCGDKVLAVASASLTASTETLSSTADSASRLDCEAEPVWDCGDTNVVYKSSQPFSLWRVVDTLAVNRLDSQLRSVLLSQLGSTAAVGAAGSSSQRRRSHNLHATGSSHGHSHSHTAQGSASAGTLHHQQHHHHAHDAALALRDHVPFLLRGLHETQTIEGAHNSQTPSKPLRPPSWSVYECPLCGVSLCALASATDKLALPVGQPRFQY